METISKKVLLMIKMYDFSKYELSSRNLEYGGRAGEKKGIIFNNENWFLKFPKSSSNMKGIRGMSYVTSTLNEYIGSQIYKILGIDVHETLLGICFDGKRYKVVCACKDFIKDDKNELLIQFTALRNDTNEEVMNREDESLSASNINEIIFQLGHNAILSQIKDAKKRFWDVVIVDMLINNNDRNEDNWGVIKDKRTNSYRMSPVYDCGNCFYGKTDDEKIAGMLSDPERLESSALNCVTAYDNNKDTQIYIKDILKIDNDDLKKEIKEMYLLAKEKMNEIQSFINEIPNSFNGIDIISDLRKEYYIKTFKMRFEQILEKNL